MKNMIRAVFWVILFLVFCLLFYIAEDALSADADTILTVYTDSGSVTVTMAEYLPNALGAEMPALYDPEALKAQAVAIRSYVMSSTRHGDMSVCTDSSCCLGYMTDEELSAFWGGDSEQNMSALECAVRDTDGQYLTWEGEPAAAVFHASSDKVTENSSALWSDTPYLVSVETPEQTEISSLSLTPDELENILGLSPETEPARWLEAVRYEDSGRVRAILLCGQCFTGTYLRNALGLASTDMDITFDGTSFLFTVRGKGHGIGMSQSGANTLAGAGWSYTDILSHYYPGTQLVTPAAETGR